MTPFVSPRLLLALILCGLSATPGAADRLPTGFEGIAVGDPWPQRPAGGLVFHHRATLNGSFDRAARACGAALLVAERSDRRVLLDVQDSTVTSIARARPLAPGSDLFRVRDRWVARYGPPDTEVHRDLLGETATRPAEVRYIVLYYDRPDSVRIDISGPALWQEQVTVRYHDARLHQNRNQRCVRQRQARAGGR